MIELANSIRDVIGDYRNHDGIAITAEDIMEWAIQFGDHAQFMLEELAHIVPQVYLSRSRAKHCIGLQLDRCLAYYGYQNIQGFLTDTSFLDMQEPHKSQPAILVLLNEVLSERYGESYLNYVTFPKRIYIYLDDVLASGSTIGRHMVEFLKSADDKGKPFADKLLEGEIRLGIGVFCLHSWGYQFQKHRLQKEFSDKLAAKIRWDWNYEVQNHGKFNNQRLNVAKPIKANNITINAYLEGLAATKYEDYAYRSVNEPAVERFFTSAENRGKFETILVEKGIEIIRMIKGEVKTNMRPLGLINPDYKIFGLGTHFFTWRNIPNNSPLVYWWQVEGHDWKPLFPVANRG